MQNLVVYIYGKGGSVEEAEYYKVLFPNCDVIGFDYHCQTPWEAKKEFNAFFWRKKEKHQHITLIANSIGAFLTLSSLDETLVERAYFISPIVNMEKLISDMMRIVDIIENELVEKKEIVTTFGETIS